MDCLVWEWAQNCTDIPNLHALMWEIVAGVIIGLCIALPIWRIQSKKANTRKTHDEKAIVNLLGNVRDTVRRFADDIIYFQKEKATEEQETEMQKQFQGVLKIEASEIQDIINTSFDVVDSSILDNLRTLKIMIEKPMHSKKIETGQLLMIENHIWYILFYRLNKARQDYIQELKKWHEDQVKRSSQNESQESLAIIQDYHKSELKKFSVSVKDPNSVFKKIQNKTKSVSNSNEKKPSFVDSRGQMYFD